MPKHNFATVSKAVHVLTFTLCIQVDYALFFQDKLGFLLVVNGDRYLPILFVIMKGNFAQNSKKKQKHFFN